MNVEMMSLVMIPQEELTNLKATQQEILFRLKEIQSKPVNNTLIQDHITAKEFMSAVRICRSKFDQLVLANQIKTVKKVAGSMYLQVKLTGIFLIPRSGKVY
jgi:hypothetical protein